MSLPIIKNINIYRGDATTLTFANMGIYAGDQIHFVVKAERSISDITIIQLLNKLVTITGNSGIVELEGNDTADITLNKLYYDVYNVTKSITHYTGEINLLPDVTTPFDGYTMPLANRKVVCIDITSFNVNEMLIVKMVNGVKQFVPITLLELKNLLNNV